MISLPALMVNVIPSLRANGSDGELSTFYNEVTELFDYLLENNLKFDFKSYFELIKRIYQAKISLPSSFNLQQFIDYLRREAKQDEVLRQTVSDNITLLNFILEFAHEIDRDPQEIPESEMLEFLETTLLSSLRAARYADIRYAVTQSNFPPKEVEFYQKGVTILETGLKHMVRLLEKPNFDPELDRIPADQLVKYYHEFNTSWTHLSGLFSQLMLGLVIWNASPKPDSHDFDFPEQGDYRRIPADFLSQLHEEMEELQRKLLNFWDHISQVSKGDFSLDFYKGLEDPIQLEKISQVKLKLAKMLRPTEVHKDLKRFVHRDDALDFLFTILDENLPENIDIEKYLNDTEFE